MKNMQNSVLDDIWVVIDSIKGQIAVLEDKLKLLEEAAAESAESATKAEGDVTCDETSPTAKVEECVTAPEAAAIAAPASAVAEEMPKPKKEPILIIDPSIEYGYATPDPRYLSGEIKVEGDEPAYDPAYDLDLVEPFEPAAESVTKAEGDVTCDETSPTAKVEECVTAPAVAVETVADKAEKEIDVIDIMDLPPVGGPAVIDLMTAKLAWKNDMPGSPVKNVLSAISLNDRVLFINTLFGEDPVKFSKTIQTFNGYESLAQAEAYIAENFADWNLESDVVYRFMMAVRRKLKK